MKINDLKKIINCLPPHAKLLDAGCGEGRASALMKSMRGDIEFYGIDINKEFKSKVPKFMRFFVGDATKTKFKNGFFDAIVCLHVVEHLERPRAALDEFYRILKPGGSLVIETPHKISYYVPRFLGYNFWQDPTHKTAYTKRTLSELTSRFKIKKIKIDSSIHNYFNKSSILRDVLNKLGLNKTVVWAHAEK